MLFALRSSMLSAAAPRYRRGPVARGSQSRASRCWLWGVLPYLWLALFSNPLHTHAPGQSALHGAASICAQDAPVSAATECHTSAVSPGRLQLSLEESCVVCQWLSFAVAVGVVAIVLLASGSRNTFGRCAGLHSFGTLRGTRARGPPPSLMFSA
jgi:hypothetical protein